MLIKKTEKRKEKMRRRHIWEWRRRGVEERRERKKEMDVDIFYIRGRRRNKRGGEGSFVVKWGIIFIGIFYQMFYQWIIKY
jgi:hypothetical protein